MLGLLLLGHIHGQKYYQIEGGERRFYLLEDSSKVFITIDDNDSLIKMEVAFVKVKEGIIIDNFESFLWYKKTLLTELNHDKHIPSIDAGTSWRVLNKTFKVINPHAKKYSLDFALTYHQAGKEKKFSFVKPILHQTKYSIQSWDMHDFTMLFIPLLCFALLAVIIVRVIVQFIKKD